jgi:hypothetical protein
MTSAEVAAAYRAGVVADDTFCWKDGMGDWLPLVEIAELAAACGAGKAAPAPVSVAPAPAPALAPIRAPLGGAVAATAASAPGNGSGPGLAAASTPLAARRAGGRAGGGDLFGGIAQAGSEEDVLTSAPVGIPQPHDEAQKMTGERNENSVLFSLAALTSGPGVAKAKPVPGQEASGLIDIKQLSAQLNSSAEEKKRSRIDDIMNLAGGGAFSPSLHTAPVMSAPAIPDFAAEALAPAAPPPRSRAIIFGAVFLGLVVIVGAIGTAVTLMGKGSETAGNAKTGSSAAASETAASASVAMASPSATDATGSSSAATAATDSAPTASATGKSATTSRKAAAAAGAGETAATTPTAPPKETSLAAAMAGAATPPAAAPATPAAGSDQPFNMGEAKARLGAAAEGAQSCKKGDGATGTGRVVVVFAPSGAAQSATISGPPFQGTPTGNCVAARFRGVHVPAFSGSPFSVSKSFTIN